MKSSLIFERQKLLREAVVGIREQPKCYGIAKNYFTRALKTDPSKVTLPTYPWIFSKPFTS